MYLCAFEDSNTMYPRYICYPNVSKWFWGQQYQVPQYVQTPRYVFYPGVSVCLEDSSPRYPKYVILSDVSMVWRTAAPSIPGMSYPDISVVWRTTVWSALCVFIIPESVCDFEGNNAKYLKYVDHPVVSPACTDIHALSVTVSV